MSDEILGLKLIHLNTHRVSEPDDPTYPFVLDVNYRNHEFMEVTMAFLFPEGEVLKLRSMTREALSEFIERNNLLQHPRLRRATITGPDGVETLK